jgi:hypothetical protein
MSRIRIKISLWVILLALLFGGGFYLYLTFANQTRIQDILQKGEALVEQKDLDGLMDMISSGYRDPYGLDRAGVREVLTGLFRDFDHFEISAQKPVIRFEGETAKARIPLQLKVDWAGARAFLVGSNPRPAPVTIVFRKEGLRWKVIRVEGVK